MATSNTAKRTNGVYNGLRVYDLSPKRGKSLAVVGPDGADPRTLDPENLPVGFRQVALQDIADCDEDEAEIGLYSQIEHWRESHYVGSVIDSALISAGATGEEAHTIANNLFDDLLDDLQCDTINFLVDRGYSVSCKPIPMRIGNGVIVRKYRPEQQGIIEKALEAAVTASKSAYEERAVELVEALRREAEANRDAKRLELFDEAVELLEEVASDSRIDDGHSQRINEFLAKVAKN